MNIHSFNCSRRAHCWVTGLVTLGLFAIGLLLSLLIENNRRAEAQSRALEDATRMAR